MSRKYDYCKPHINVKDGSSVRPYTASTIYLDRIFSKCHYSLPDLRVDRENFGIPA